MKVSFDGNAERRKRYTGSREIIPVGTETCPDCGADVDAETVRVDALFAHGGYGATKRTTRTHCTSCTWSTVPDVSEERPPRGQEQ